MAASSESKIRRQFATDALKCHNEYRKKHGVPKLELDKKLCEFAQEWAEECARTSQMEHRSSCPYGENLYSYCSSDPNQGPSAQAAVKAWYDEIQIHTFGQEIVNNDSLHFTQVIWKTSKNLGIAIADDEKGQYYVVAYYNPKGNYLGQFVENVPRPKG